MILRGKFSTVDEYIALHALPVRQGLELIRKTIKQAAPQAEETISYQMPAYRLKGMLVYFAAMKEHYGFYPTSSPMAAFREKLKNYSTSKGAIRFPLEKPIPVKLIREIVKWRATENQAKEILKVPKAKTLRKKTALFFYLFSIYKRLLKNGLSSSARIA